MNHFLLGTLILVAIIAAAFGGWGPTAADFAIYGCVDGTCSRVTGLFSSPFGTPFDCYRFLLTQDQPQTMDASSALGCTQSISAFVGSHQALIGAFGSRSAELLGLVANSIFGLCAGGAAYLAVRTFSRRFDAAPKVVTVTWAHAGQAFLVSAVVNLLENFVLLTVVFGEPSYFTFAVAKVLAIIKFLSLIIGLGVIAVRMTSLSMKSRST